MSERKTETERDEMADVIGDSLKGIRESLESFESRIRELKRDGGCAPSAGVKQEEA